MEFVYLIALLELAAIVLGLYKIKKIVSAYKKDKRVYYYHMERAENALMQVFGEKWIIHLLISEIEVFYYAIFGWFIKKRTYEGVKEYHYAKDTMYGVMIWVIIFASIVEIPVAHILLSRWNTTAAWIITGLTIYGMLWLIGDYKSIKYHPIRLSSTHLLIRIALHYKTDIELTDIEAIECHVSEEQKEEYTNLTLMTTVEPNIYISLKYKVNILTLFGGKKRANKIALYLDEPGEFIDDIEKSLA